ncbi:MAG: TetR/AcrR family transcriptional regulator [Phycisphaerales bacterium]|nr:TetR/AcrR family transcriptional regulator [Hyphomonadaceae bacterium]
MARLADPLLAERRRRQIMDAAIACFRRRGFHQATMQEICAEADISAGALYRYFASKADIIAAIAEEHRGESDDAFLRAAEKEGIIPALCLAARNFFDKFAIGDGALIADIFAEAIRDDAIAAPLRAIDARSVTLFVQALRAAQARREIDVTLNAEDAAETLFAAIEGIGLRRAFLRDTNPDAAVAQFRAFAERYLSHRP